MVTRTQREVNPNGLVECGISMFRLGAPALSLLSAFRSHPSIASLLPGGNKPHTFFVPMTTGQPNSATQPGESKGKASTVNVADGNGLSMVVAKFDLWPKKNNKNVSLFLVCLSNSKVSTFLPRPSQV